jgi:hypothetical protein
MGKSVIPFIYEDILNNGPDYWFLALREIAGIDPVKKEDYGYIDRVTKSWLDWIKANYDVA